MKGMRLWLLFSWAAALYVGVMLFLSGGQIGRAHV